MTNDEEITIIKEFLFYICSKYEISITIGHFHEWEDFDLDDNTIENPINISGKLIPYSNAMDLYNDALYVDNVEIKYLYLYKIIEYYSPIIAKKKAYELLNQRLDTMPISKRDHKYLESLFDLTRRYDLSLKDRELTYTVLNETIDIVSLYDYLPSSIKKNLSKTYNFTSINNLDEEKKDNIIRKIATILYATRNNIVHAKSNYHPSGDECKTDDLSILNDFMLKVCYCVIVWNGRQSEEYRI